MEKKKTNRKDNIECFGKGLDALEGTVLAGRYLVGSFIDKGS
jgi:hypothetical protein